MAKLTPIKAIRAECLECSNGQWKEVRLCPMKNCPLYEYRNGHRPKEGEGIKENDLGKKIGGQGGTFYQERGYRELGKEKEDCPIEKNVLYC